MSAKSITSLGPLVLLLTPQIGLASDVGCNGEAASRLSQIRERWQWEMFWDAGVKIPPDAAGKRIHVEVFWNRDEVGFCSLDLGSCAKYAIIGDMLGQMTASAAIPEQQRNLAAATEAFLNAPVLPPVVTRVPSGSSGNDRTGTVFSNGKQSISLPAPSRSGGGQGASFRACTTEEAVPSPEPPETLRKRTTPDDLPQVKTLLTHMGQNIPPAMRASTEFIVPSYSEPDPMIYILVRTKGSSDSIIFLMRDGQSQLWKVGGHFEAPMGQFQLDRLVPKILARQMAVVKAG